MLGDMNLSKIFSGKIYGDMPKIDVDKTDKLVKDTVKTAKQSSGVIDNITFNSDKNIMNIKNKIYGNFSNKNNFNVKNILGNSSSNHNVKNILGRTSNISINGGYSNVEKQAWNRMKIQSYLPHWGDIDKDGVPNILDCQPLNPLKQGPENKLPTYKKSGKGWVGTPVGSLRTYSQELDIPEPVQLPRPVEQPVQYADDSLKAKMQRFLVTTNENIIQPIGEQIQTGVSNIGMAIKQDEKPQTEKIGFIDKLTRGLGIDKLQEKQMEKKLAIEQARAAGKEIGRTEALLMEKAQRDAQIKAMKDIEKRRYKQAFVQQLKEKQPVSYGLGQVSQGVRNVYDALDVASPISQGFRVSNVIGGFGAGSPNKARLLMGGGKPVSAQIAYGKQLMSLKREQEISPDMFSQSGNERYIEQDMMEQPQMIPQPLMQPQVIQQPVVIPTSVQATPGAAVVSPYSKRPVSYVRGPYQKQRPQY
jgi:hypothetical protein